MEQSAPTICIGLMSGTSLDGVDAVAADFSGPVPVIRGRSHEPFAPELKAELLALCRPGENELERAGEAAQALARAYARAVDSLIASARIPRAAVRAVGAHGQTVRHVPSKHFSIQLNSPSLLAELTGFDVIADFRSADLAAGGEGAPLVPAFHQKVFQSESARRAIVNIGGIANITFLPPARSGEKVYGFDCGPGNMLMDAWAQARIGRPYDEDGAWAASGTRQNDLLDLMLAEPYFRLAPPKSTGRELFSFEWLKERIEACARSMRARDIEATLLTLTARGIADAIAAWGPATSEVYLCGGGALNPVLAKEIAGLMPTRRVQSTDALGIRPMDVEGLAFAWLAHAWLEREPANCPEVTGAAGPRRLGALYPASGARRS